MNTAVALVLLASLVTPAAANYDTHHVQLAYMIPRGAPRRDRSQLMLRAAKIVHKQWSNWGYTFQLKNTIPVVEVSETCEHLTKSSWTETQRVVRNKGFKDPKVKYSVFLECVSASWAVAWAIPSLNVYLDHVINGIERELRGNTAIKTDVGAIGHEWGHSFGLPHENCGGTEPNNAAGLKKQGLPTGGTASVMCNSRRFPSRQTPPVRYQRTLMFSRSGHAPCNWFRECSGGGKRPSSPVPRAGVRHVRVHGSRKCIEVHRWSRGNGGNIVQWRCHRGENQQWTLVPRSGGYMLKSKLSNKCMDVAYASRRAGANIEQHSCHGGSNQIVTIRNGALVFKHSGMCLDVHGGGSQDGANVVQWPCHGGANQRMTFIR